jgi:D-sedoheptulose 7-phosphate isomerase
MNDFNQLFTAHVTDHLTVAQALSGMSAQIRPLADAWLAALHAGKKVLFFGNGGSAADAQHLAAELVVRFRQNRRALPGIALTTDTSILTAHSNDFGFESVFARQVEALAQPGDVVVGISTSGNSPSIMAGLKAAKAAGCVTICFTGAGGGACAPLADLVLHVPSDVTARIQECHMLVGHVLCDWVEDAFSEPQA